MPAPPLPSLGDRIRVERTRQGVSLRALARVVGVSASMISQIETGKSRPSVSTLYGITSALRMSLHDIFQVSDVDTADEAGSPAEALVGVGRRTPTTFLEALASRRGSRLGPLVRPSQRQVLPLDSGVTWERLGELPRGRADFLRVTYEPGGSSSRQGELMTHPGWEYGYLLRGELTLILGLEEIVISPGDAVSFDARTPHRYRNDTIEVAVGVWFVADDGGTDGSGGSGGGGGTEALP